MEERTKEEKQGLGRGETKGQWWIERLGREERERETRMRGATDREGNQNKDDHGRDY